MSKYDKKLHAWSAGEIEYLRSHYDNQSIREIAERLGRTKSAVLDKARDLELGPKTKVCYGRPTKIWTKEEIERVKQLRMEGKTVKEIAKLLNRTYSAVHTKVFRHGFTFTQYNMRIGKQTEEEAIPILEKNGFMVVEKGDNASAFDLLIQKDGKRYAVNVTCAYSATMREGNLNRLFALGIPMILWKTTNGWFASIWTKLVQ